MLVDAKSYTANVCDGEAVVIVLPGAPVAKARARVTRRGTAYTPVKTRQYERALGFQALAAMRGRGGPIAGPVSLTVEIVLAVPKSWPARKRLAAISGCLQPASKPDIDNYVKAALDGVNAIVVADDAQVTELVAIKRYGESPQLRVTVEPILDFEEGVMTGGLIVRAWRPLERNTLRGFVTVEVPGWHLTISDIAVHQANSGSRWAQLPAKPQIDHDRQLVVRDGKVQYANIIWFTDGETRQRFSDAVIAAVDAYLNRAAA